jgi:hypothetical protein
MPTFWSALEQMPGLNAIPAAWTRLMGPAFETLKAPFFRQQAELARACFCEKCYCAHEVVTRYPAPSGLSPLRAVCRCETGSCPDISLTPADLEIWELSWPSLGRALCRALGLDSRSGELLVYSTRQIGSWSGDAVPVFLSIQTEPEDLRGAVAELVARLQHPFILLAPTATHLNATCRELLAHAQAGFFPLDSTVLFTEHATFRPARAPGELFARFNPQPETSLPEDAARKAMAIIKTLDFGPPPTPLTVFRLYCIENLAIPRIVSDLESSRATIFRRLHDLRQATGKAPAELRALSNYFDGREGQI